MTDVLNTREIVLGILIDVTENKIFSNKAINGTLNKYRHLEKRDRAFISRLSEGTIEYLIRIDYILEQFSTVKTKKMKPIIKNILRMSVYQIMFMDSINNATVCNEAVKLAQKKGFKGLKGFVNGVLRNIVRNIENIEYPCEKDEPVKYLSIMYSVPQWIIFKWLDTYNYNTVKKICEYFINESKTYIRCNLNKATAKEVEEELVKQGITVEKGSYLSYAMSISGYDYIDKIEGFKKGLFTIQDESSMLVAEIAAPQEGDFIIDVCAAPGGKSVHLAEKLKGTGCVSARDINKMEYIEDNIKRLGIKNIKTKVQDALVLDSESINKADIVVVDAPCSGLGVLGKKTDIKYNATFEGITSLSQIQRNILDVVHEYVREKGVLIYSTCTISKEENIDNIIWFTDNYPFELESIDKYIPKSLIDENTSQGHLQMIPGIHNADGFFIARLRKKQNG